MAQPVDSARIASYCPIAPLKNAIRLCWVQLQYTNFLEQKQYQELHENHKTCIIKLGIMKNFYKNLPDTSCG